MDKDHMRCRHNTPFDVECTRCLAESELLDQ